LGLPNRVNNIGLMADKQNYLIASGVLLIVGLILCYLPQSQPVKEKEKERKNKKCPQCAEQVLEEAKVCRCCNYTFKAEEVTS
jgi:hypothetical protein